MKLPFMAGNYEFIFTMHHKATGEEKSVSDEFTEKGAKCRIINSFNKEETHCVTTPPKTKRGKPETKCEEKTLAHYNPDDE